MSYLTNPYRFVASFTPLIDGSDLKAYYRFSESSSPFENLAGNVTDNDSIGSSGDLDVNDGGDPNHIEYEESTVAGESSVKYTNQ